MRQKNIGLLSLVLVIVLSLLGCVASHLDEAKKQYSMALQSEDPLPYYKAALEELDSAIARDNTQFQAYALKGLIYRNLEDFDLATQNLKVATQGSFTGELQWVPVIINLTYGDVFHAKASVAIRSGDWDLAKSHQNRALEFFENVISTSFGTLGEASGGDEVGVSMQELYLKAQGRWAAAKFQMATIAGRVESKERQSELLREVIASLSQVVKAYPEATSLRYYLASGYRKQALTIRRTDPIESERLQKEALSQLRVCADVGLAADLRGPAAQLFSTLSRGAEPEIEQKLLGNAPLR